MEAELIRSVVSVGAPVEITLADGHTYHGHLDNLTASGLVLRPAQGPPVIIALTAVTTLIPTQSPGPAPSARPTERVRRDVREDVREELRDDVRQPVREHAPDDVRDGVRDEVRRPVPEPLPDDTREHVREYARPAKAAEPHAAPAPIPSHAPASPRPTDLDALTQLPLFPMDIRDIQVPPDRRREWEEVCLAIARVLLADKPEARVKPAAAAFIQALHLLTADPGNAGLNRLVGQLAACQENLSNASYYLEIAANSGDLPAWRLLAITAAQLGDGDRAVSALLTFFRKARPAEHAESWQALLACLDARGRRDWLRTLLGSEAHDAAARETVLIALAGVPEGSPPPPPSAPRFTSPPPENASATAAKDPYELAKGLERAKDFEGAQAAYRKAIARGGGKRASAVKDLASLTGRAEGPEAALRVIEQEYAGLLRPGDTLDNIMIDLLSRADRHHEALERLERQARRFDLSDGKRYHLLVRIARARLHCGQDATAAWQAVLDLHPDDHGAQRGMAVALIQKAAPGDLDRAEHLVRDHPADRSGTIIRRIESIRQEAPGAGAPAPAPDPYVTADLGRVPDRDRGRDPDRDPAPAPEPERESDGDWLERMLSSGGALGDWAPPLVAYVVRNYSGWPSGAGDMPDRRPEHATRADLADMVESAGRWRAAGQQLSSVQAYVSASVLARELGEPGAQHHLFMGLAALADIVRDRQLRESARDLYCAALAAADGRDDPDRSADVRAMLIGYLRSLGGRSGGPGAAGPDAGAGADAAAEAADPGDMSKGVPDGGAGSGPSGATSGVPDAVAERVAAGVTEDVTRDAADDAADDAPDHVTDEPAEAPRDGGPGGAPPGNDLADVLEQEYLNNGAAVFDLCLSVIAETTLARDLLLEALAAHPALHEAAAAYLGGPEKAEPAAWLPVAERWSRTRRMFERTRDELLSTTAEDGGLESVVIRLRELLNSSPASLHPALTSLRSGMYQLLRFERLLSFEDREESLRRAGHAAQDVLAEISLGPTSLAVTLVEPVAVRLQQLTDEARSGLLASRAPRPELSLALEESSGGRGGGLVTVQIKVANGAGLAPIESPDLVVSDIRGMCMVAERSVQLPTVPGGEHHIRAVKLRITEQALAVGAFSLPVTLRYRPRDGESVEQFQTRLPVRLAREEEFKPIPNPYHDGATGRPVQNPEMFYGRAELIDRVRSRLRDAVTPGAGVAIFGQKRAGKSSIRHHLVRQLHHLDGLPVVDIGNIGSLSPERDDSYGVRLWGLLMWRILEGAHKTLHALDPEDTHGAGPLIPDGFTRQQFLAGTEPVHECAEFIRLHRERYTGGRPPTLTVLIDEFQYIDMWIRQGILSPSFMQSLKALIERQIFHLVIVGQDALDRMVQEDPNVFGVFSTERVTYLTATAARQLIERPIAIVGGEGGAGAGGVGGVGGEVSRFRERAADRVLELTGGSPFYIQRFCWQLVEYMNSERVPFITEADVEHVRDDFLRQLEVKDFDNLESPGYTDPDAPTSKNYQDVLLAVARACDEDGSAAIQAINAHYGGERLLELLGDLELRDVVRRRSGRYRIVVRLYQEWLLRTYGATSAVDTPRGRGADGGGAGAGAGGGGAGAVPGGSATGAVGAVPGVTGTGTGTAGAVPGGTGAAGVGSSGAVPPGAPFTVRMPPQAPVGMASPPPAPAPSPSPAETGLLPKARPPAAPEARRYPDPAAPMDPPPPHFTEPPPAAGSPPHQNPYSEPGRVAEGEDFIGRAGLIREVHAFWLGSARPSNLRIIGHHRTGKTSLARRALETLPDNRPDLIPVWVDLGTHKKEYELFRTMAKEVLKSLRGAHATAPPGLLDRARPIAESILGAVEWYDLREFVHDFFCELRMAGQYVLLILDEFDHAPKVFRELAEFQLLRTLVSDSRYSLGVTTISRRDIEPIEQEAAGGLSLGPVVPNVCFVGMFSDAEADLMLARAARVDVRLAGVKAEILAHSGAHPFLLELLCQHLVAVQRTTGRIDPASAYEQASPSFVRQFGSLVENIDADSDGRGSAVLRDIAHGEPPPDGAADLVSRMHNMGVLSLRNGRPTLLSQAFTHYIRTHVPPP